MKSPGILLLCLALSGCRHVPVAPEVGRSSFVVVEPPPALSKADASETPALTNRTQYRQARVKGDPALPVYPPRALAAQAGAAQVGVRVTVDTEGRVADLRPSMLAATIVPPDFAADFQEAVETAVRQWKFTPARLDTIETVTTNGFTYERVARSERLEVEFDLAFTFTSSGKVESGTSTHPK